MDLGLFLIRAVVGSLLAGHGIQKLVGRLGGYGLAGTGGHLEALGLRPGKLYAALAGTAELTGGVLFVIGLATPFAALLIASTMFVAARTDHAGKGLWIFNGGAEYVVTVAAIVLAVVIMGPGEWSLDGAFGLQVSGVVDGVATLTLSVIGASAILAFRNRAEVATSADDPSGSPDMTEHPAM